MTAETEHRDGSREAGGAVVTGVGWGAGLELARTLARLGYTVHVTDPDAALATEAASQLGSPAFGSALDVRSPAACRAAAARTRRRTGSLEVWVNNAAALSAGPAWELDERTRQRLLEVNLGGTINGTLAALEIMRAAGSGHVVNVVPLPKRLSAPGQAVFSASRQAAIAFAVGVQADLGRAGLNGVNVSSLCPSGEAAHALDSNSGDPGLTASPGLAEELVRLLNHALDDPAPVLATPEWRARLLRFYYLWPGPAAAARRALTSAARSGSRRRPRSP
jgi:NAD(P)-dependent dehydrogenase (short-subunit alcohol dehydrogenase family)